MAKFGLGKGLAELQTEMGASPDMATLTGIGERVVVRPIPIDQIGANPDQPRKTFSEDELDDLAQSIREHGVLQPIIVRSVSGAPHLYEIVAGERRWRASKIAGRDTIPALVKTFAPETAMEVALIENVQRENLNAIEECEAYKGIMEKCGYTLGDLSNLIGKSESYIRNVMRLDALPKGVKELVKSGELSASHARTLAVADNAEALAKKIVEEELSVLETEKLVRAAPRRKASRKAKRADEELLDIIKKAERGIEDSTELRAKLLISGKHGAGHLRIYFENHGERELLVALIIQAATKGIYDGTIHEEIK